MFFLASGNYFNGGVRHKPAFDQALDRLVTKFTGDNRALADVVRYEYTDWKKVHRLQGDDSFYDRGAVSGDARKLEFDCDPSKPQ